ncbi:hypothetical protein Srot_0436 [Segniliparus rotundus DSM 44985]|uniref:Uncharacterized protein n=1 Tax=Segniliparus rotundus (strain ATCC BAA-972 / CDC 1076 / CIP 108378 / DSM 44985 / JCM 13578) TaxID=640132 RepID=D6ZBU6_SEGRD|nr:hypothetical protein [Segniliparus rotundus]ADG96923.1 hypothetical protein Srot_0436 [Segniliparus rotundus DSM 44985]
MAHDDVENPDADDTAARFEENMRAGEALQPADVRAAAARYRHLADGILDHFHNLAATADDCEEEVPEGLDDLQRKAEHLRGYADRLLDFADRAEEAKSVVARLRGLPSAQLSEKDKHELAKSLRDLYEPLPQMFGLDEH